MMTTQSSPTVTEMKVIPVAGQDSMLLNIGGAHNAWFTRNIVVLKDSAGNTGVGEAPGPPAHRGSGLGTRGSWLVRSSSALVGGRGEQGDRVVLRGCRALALRALAYS